VQPFGFELPVHFEPPVGVSRFVRGFGSSLGGLADIGTVEFGIWIVELRILVFVR